jgi:chromosome segregation ATPase
MTERAESVSVYFDEELQDLKGQVARLQQQLGQALQQLRDQDGEVRETHAVATGIRGQLAALPRFQDDLLRLKEAIERLQAEYQDDRRHRDEDDRRLQEERERERQTRSEQAFQFVDIQRDLEEMWSKLRNTEEQQRRLNEQSHELENRIDELGRRDDVLAARAHDVSELLRRADEERARLQSEIEALVKQDEVLITRLQTALDQVRRADEQSVQAIKQSEGFRELAERLEQQRAERQHLMREQTDLGERLNRVIEQQDDHVRMIRQAETKVDLQADLLTQLRETIRAQEVTMDQQLREILLLLERQRSRTLSHLEQEVRELKQHVSRGPGI